MKYIIIANCIVAIIAMAVGIIFKEIPYVCAEFSALGGWVIALDYLENNKK